mmetsp:Transcript_7658/g.20399  ORF Transcript_7658/g.20399 Transcript_7658/m.20399 type:complete len:242 (-) Transcript_7658:631-1356(-)
MEIMVSRQTVATAIQANGPSFIAAAPAASVPSMYSYHSRTAGSDIRNHSTSLYVMRGLVGGIHKEYFKKNTFSSNARPTTMMNSVCKKRFGLLNWHHWNLSQVYGPSWAKERRAFAPRPFSSLKPCQLYLSYLQSIQRTVAIPREIPIRLHTATSSTQLSYQHSLKLGSMWPRLSSNNSKPMEMTHRMKWLRSTKALAHQPMRCAETNSSSRVDLMPCQFSARPPPGCFSTSRRQSVAYVR